MRCHFLRSISAIFVFTVVSFLANSFLFENFLSVPSKIYFITYTTLCRIADALSIPALCIEELPFIIQSRQMTGQFSMHMTSSLVIGLIVAFPYLFWEIWRFISPGLHENERKSARGAVFFVS